MLKRKLRALDEVEAQFRTEYEKQSDGFFHLKLDADDDADDDEDGQRQESAKLKAFRKEAIRMRAELEEWKKKFEGIDMDAYQNAVKYAEQARSEEEKALLKAGRIDDVIASRQAALVAKHQAELRKATELAIKHETDAKKFKQELRGDRVRAKVRADADELKLKLLPSAVPDFYRRALDTFDLDEHGELVAMDGEDIRLNREHKPYTAKDFIQDVVDTAPHLLEGASGTDIAGGPRKARRVGGLIEIDASDTKALQDNIENIAKGKVRVRVT